MRSYNGMWRWNKTKTAIIGTVALWMACVATAAPEAGTGSKLEAFAKNASTEECQSVLQENQDKLSYMMADELRVAIEGGKGILTDVFNGNLPQEIEKLRSHQFEPARSEPPPEFQDFSEYLKSNESDARCLMAGAVADIQSWRDGRTSMIGTLVNEWTKQLAAIESAEKDRQAARFSSFDEAQTRLAPLIDDDPSSGMAIYMNPMSLKGEVIALRLRVVQVLGRRTFLLTNLPVGYPEMDGKYFYGVVSAGYGGKTDLVDDQIVDVVGEVVGTHHYTTPLMVTKTVPKIKIYGVR